MKKLSLVVLLGLVFSVVALTGCSPSDNSSGGAATNAAPTAPSTNK